MSSFELPAAKEYPAVCVRVGEHFVLGFGQEGVFLGQPAFGAPVFVRTAFRFVLSEDDLFPYTVIDDRGNAIGADEVVGWIHRRGYAFPRADVLGLTQDGTPRSCFMKELDLELRRAYAARSVEEFPGIPIALAVEVANVSEGWAITPNERFAPELALALPVYRLHSSTLGALSSMLLHNVLNTRRRDVRITLDDLDEYLADREE